LYYILDNINPIICIGRSYFSFFVSSFFLTRALIIFFISMTGSFLSRGKRMVALVVSWPFISVLCSSTTGGVCKVQYVFSKVRNKLVGLCNSKKASHN